MAMMRTVNSQRQRRWSARTSEGAAFSVGADEASHLLVVQLVLLSARDWHAWGHAAAAAREWRAHHGLVLLLIVLDLEAALEPLDPAKHLAHLVEAADAREVQQLAVLVLCLEVGGEGSESLPAELAGELMLRRLLRGGERGQAQGA